MPGQIFIGFCFFVGIGKNVLTEHSQIVTKISNHSCPLKSTKSFPDATITKRTTESRKDKTKIGVGTYVTVKVGEIDEKIREGKSRRMRKDLVGLYYLSRISSVLVISRFW